MSNFVVLIPARYESSRFPGKPLIDLAGKSMIQRVYEQARASEASAVWVATDDARIEAAVEAFGGECVMTRPDHETGTDRLHEAASRLELSPEQVVVNVQGDEPLMPPAVINQVAGLISERASMATLYEPISDRAELFDPNIVKLVTDDTGLALYFSRAPIPWDRDLFSDGEVETPDSEGKLGARHLGIYAYTVQMLSRFVAWPPAGLERTERLEQLRVLANGGSIAVAESQDRIPPGIDVPSDVERTLEAIRRGAAA